MYTIQTIWDDYLSMLNKLMTYKYLQHVRHYEYLREEISYIDFHTYRLHLSTHAVTNMNNMNNMNNIITTPVSATTNTTTTLSAISTLQDGHNPNLTLKLRCLHGTHFPHSTFILAIDDNTPTLSPDFYLLAVVWSKDTTNLTTWRHSYTFNLIILVHHPYKRATRLTALPYLLITLYSLTYSSIPSKKYTHEVIKDRANVLFKSHKYHEALLMYELALGHCVESDTLTTRAILYSNSSCCLYKIRLYESSLLYANISLRVDPHYPKSYFRKMNALLELCRYPLVPHCLLNLFKLVDSAYFKPLNEKYMGYLSNHIGIFNWREIQRNYCMGEYLSESVRSKYTVKEATSRKRRGTYYAKKEILPYELLVVNKPLIYSKLAGGLMNNLPTFIDLIQKFSDLYESFGTEIRELAGCDGYSSKCMFPNDIINAIERGHILQETIYAMTDNGNCGIWSKLNRFEQSCDPNCSYLHFKTFALVFAFRRIRTGETLTLDFFKNNMLNYRQLILRKRLGKYCKCGLCTYDWYKHKQAEYVLYLCQHNTKLSLKLRKLLLWKSLSESYHIAPGIALYISTGYHYESLPSYMKHNTILSYEMYSQLVQCYISLTEEEPTWYALINLKQTYDQEEADTELAQKLKSTLVKKIGLYFKLSEEAAKAFFLDLK